MAAFIRPAINSFVGSKSGFKKALVPMLFMQHSMAFSHQTKSIPVGSTATVFIEPTQIAAQKSLVKNLSFHPTSTKPDDGEKSKGKSLAIILNWMLAKRRHVMKFGNFYNNRGLDVLSVSLTPLQLLLPTTGSQVVAANVLDFLADNPQYESVLVHGFSVGGYLYGEMLNKMDQSSKYDGLSQKIVGQVFDSAVDYYSIPNGLAKAITNNRHIQKWLEMYIRYHMKFFHEISTRHYLRSSDTFHNNPVKAPSLFFFSRDDPVGTAEGNMRNCFLSRANEINQTSIEIVNRLRSATLSATSDQIAHYGIGYTIVFSFTELVSALSKQACDV
ncbi:hypothetical protein CHUAL_007758 [Chamberlinius hualienensis]